VFSGLILFIRSRICLFIICSCCLATATYGSDLPAYTVSSLSKPIDLSQAIEILDDPHHNISFEQVSAGEYDLLFRKHNQKVFIGDGIKTRYWFRLELVALPELREDHAVLYMQILPSRLYDMKVVIKSEDYNEEFRVGLLHPFSQQDKKDLHYAFHIPLVEGQKITVIGVLDNSTAPYPVTIPLTLMTEDDYADTNFSLSNVLVAYYAIMLALLFYNGILFLWLPRPIYGYYCLFLVFAMFLTFETDGNLGRWTDIARPSMNNVNPIYVAMAFLAFVYHSLNKVEFLPSYRRIYFGLLCMGWVLGTGGYLVSYTAMGILAQLYCTITILINLAVIFLSIYHRIPTSILLFIAESFTLSGGSVFMLTLQGFVAINSFTIWALHIGFLTESIMLSLAVAARTRYAQEESIRYFKKYKQIYQTSHDGLYDYDLIKHELSCNPAFLEMLGYDSQEAIGEEFLLSNDDAQNIEIYQALLECGGSITGREYSTTNKKTQKIVWLSLSITMSFDETGKPTAIKGSMIDITERKLKEEAQVLALENLTKSDRLKEEFLATISHELITPINGVVGNLELLKTHEFDPEVIEYLSNLDRSSSELTLLVNRVLNFTQVQAGSTHLDTVEFSLDSLIRPLTERYSEKCNKKNLAFEHGLDDQLPEVVSGDLAKLMDILDSLLGNALKFTDKGSVRLIVASQQDNADPSKRVFRFSVKDTGRGISLKDRQKIFSAFTQADGSFSRQYGGLGLGLTMAKCFADLMDGELIVLSEEHKGSQFDFIVTLPVVLGSQSDFIAKSVSDVYANHGKNDQDNSKVVVLIVEDNLTNQLVLKGILEKLGYCTLTADNGSEAVALLEDKVVDLVFMDCQMPVMDGFEATKQIRKNARQPKDLPIVAITANVMHGDREKCLAAGMDDYLKKPITKRLIEVKMKQWLSVLGNSANS